MPKTNQKDLFLDVVVTLTKVDFDTDVYNIMFVSISVMVLVIRRMSKGDPVWTGT